MPFPGADDLKFLLYPLKFVSTLETFGFSFSCGQLTSEMAYDISQALYSSRSSLKYIQLGARWLPLPPRATAKLIPFGMHADGNSHISFAANL